MTVEDLVRESCAAQGVPLTVEDPEVLARVASLLRTGGGETNEDDHGRRTA